MLGRLARAAGPDAVLRTAMAVYCRAYGVELDDYEVPHGGFGTFDEFFTRRLKPGARPLDPDPSVILSPADGRVEDFGRIEPGARFLVKGQTYEVGELLGDPDAGATYEGGSFAIVYLSPRDYHRVHAPVSGPVTSVRHVPGTLYPVNSIGLDHVPKLFARNERVAVHQRSERHGRVATIMVGAIGVGRITVSFDPSVVTNDDCAPGLRNYGDDGPYLQRGEELGIFHLGSTAIVFLPPEMPVEFGELGGASVRMGEALARVGGAA
jgi:phosphatidylserine decarboxylase